MTRIIQCHHIPNQLSATFQVSYTGHFTNMARKRYKELFFYFLHAFRYEMKSKSTSSIHGHGALLVSNLALPRILGPYGRGKWEKRIIGPFPVQSTLSGSFGPKFGFWALKENVAGIWLFKACWGKRYVAVYPSPQTPHPKIRMEVKKVPPPCLP